MKRIATVLILVTLAGLPPVPAMAEGVRPSEAVRTIAVLSFGANAANPERLDQLFAATAALGTAADAPSVRFRIEARFDVRRLEDARAAGIAPMKLRAIHQAGRDLAARRAAAARAALIGIVGPRIEDRVIVELVPGDLAVATIEILGESW